jgi:CheY-like chemotaxis protein
MHALVIEDDAITAMLIEDELHELGFRTVETASSEEQALAAVGRRCPDLITSDGSLTIGNGVTVVQKIRRVCRVPVIFITGDPQRAKLSIPDAPILEKPFTELQFVRMIRTVLSNALGPAQARA